jgi:hypothetical protein
MTMRIVIQNDDQPRNLRVIPLLLATLLAACASAPKACPPTDLAKLEAAYVAESIQACKAEGAHTTETCKAFPAIKVKYAAKRAAWVACDVGASGAGGAP